MEGAGAQPAPSSDSSAGADDADALRRRCVAAGVVPAAVDDTGQPFDPVNLVLVRRVALQRDLAQVLGLVIVDDDPRLVVAVGGVARKAIVGGAELAACELDA